MAVEAQASEAVFHLLQKLHVIFQRCTVVLRRAQDVHNVLTRVDAIFKPVVHPSPKPEKMRHVTVD